jgi:hypothetical protein
MRIPFAFSLLFVFQTAHAEESLCAGNEEIVFSCHVGRKIISLCRPSESPRVLTYRYGTPEHLELVHPGRGPEEQGEFYTSSSPLFGGGETTLAFTRADYEYKIYSKIGRADSGELQEDRTPIFRGWARDLTERKEVEATGVRRWRRRIQRGYRLDSKPSP